MLFSIVICSKLHFLYLFRLWNSRTRSSCSLQISGVLNGVSLYYNHNGGYSTEIVNEQCNTGDPLETSGGLYRGPPSMLICITVEPLTNDHPHQRPSLSYDHISYDGQWLLFVYESLTSDHPSYTTTPM